MGGIAIAMSACSVLVDTSGLSDGASVAGEPEASTFESGAPNEAGPDGCASCLDAGKDSGRIADGLLAFYTFDENNGLFVSGPPSLGAPGLRIRSVTPPPLEPDAAPVDPDDEIPSGSDPSQLVTWTPGVLAVRGHVVAMTDSFPSTIQSRCSASGQLTVEAWVKPRDTVQGGPARIVSMGQTSDINQRNFTLAQQGTSWVFRMRTGGVVNERTAPGATTNLTHVVVTARTSGELIFYVDGVPTRADVPAGAFDFQAFHLMLANELDAPRLWRGEYHLVAIYDRVLSPAEIGKNRAAGPNP